MHLNVDIDFWTVEEAKLSHIHTEGDRGAELCHMEKPMRLAILTVLLFSLSASAETMDKETRIKTWVLLQISIAQAKYCHNEMNKLQSKSATPFMLNQKNPANSNKRFSNNELTTYRSLILEVHFQDFEV